VSDGSVGGSTAIFDEKKKLIGGLETNLLQYPLLHG